MPPHPLTLKSMVLMLLLALIWGLSIPITKIGLASLSPLGLTVLRFAIAVPPSLLLLIGKPMLPVRVVFLNGALGVLGIGVGQLAQSYGVAYTSASVATVISAAIPLLVAIFAAIHLKQSVSLVQKLGLFAAFAGIALIALGRESGSAEALHDNLFGSALLLLSAIAIAFYYVWSVNLTNRYGAIAVSAWSTLFGFLSLLPMAWIELKDTPLLITQDALLCAAYLGLLVTVVGLFLWLNILNAVSASVAASIQYLQPLIGVVAAAYWLNEALDGVFAMGSFLVMLGIVLAIHGEKGKQSVS